MLSVSFCFISNHPKTQWLKTMGINMSPILGLLSQAGWSKMASLTSLFLAAGLGHLHHWDWWNVYYILDMVSDPPGDEPQYFQVVAGVSQQQESASTNVQLLFKFLLASHLLVSHWPKKVSWTSSESVWEGSSQRLGYKEGSKDAI